MGGQIWADLNGSNQLQMRRIFLDRLDQIAARFDASGNVSWYLNDRLGSIRGLMNNSGSLIDQLSYNSYVNNLSETTPPTAAFPMPF